MNTVRRIHPGSFAIAALLSALAGCATPSPEAQIRELEQVQAKEAIAGNRAALEQIFAPEFRIINPAGAVASKEELLQLLTGGPSPYASAVFETQQVDVYRDVVVSVGLETVVPTQGAQAGERVRRRITHVWKRDGQQWRLALRHATLVTAPP